jgi:hypothetical protein
MSIWDVAKIAKTAGDFYGEKTKQGRMGPTYKAEHPSVKADPAKLGKKRSFSDKYGGYGNLALEANKLATEGGDSVFTPGHRTGRKIPERVKSTVKISDLKKISLDEEDDNKFYA